MLIMGKGPYVYILVKLQWDFAIWSSKEAKGALIIKQPNICSVLWV